MSYNVVIEVGPGTAAAIRAEAARDRSETGGTTATTQAAIATAAAASTSADAVATAADRVQTGLDRSSATASAASAEADADRAEAAADLADSEGNATIAQEAAAAAEAARDVTLAATARTFTSISEFQLSALTYTAGSGNTVVAGDRVTIQGVGTLTIAASGASDHHYATAGGAKAYHDIQQMTSPTSGASRSVLDVSHYSGQGGASPVMAPWHDYTDASRSLQIDKVGGNIALGSYVLGLRRASNHIRRPDKDGTYVSEAGFLQCARDTFPQTAAFTGEISGNVLTVSAVSSGTLTVGAFVLWSGTDNGTTIAAQLTGSAGGVGTYTVAVRGSTAATQTVASQAMTAVTKNSILAFYIGQTGDFGWSTDRVQMTTGYVGGLYAYTFKASGAAQYIASFESSGGQILNIQDAVSGTRTDLIAPAGQTSGIRIEATGGNIDIAPKATGQVTIREKVVPGTNNAYYMGTSAANWLRVYADAYYVGSTKVIGAQQAAIADPSAITAYTAPTISDPPTAAEVQAIAAALETLRGELASTQAQLVLALTAMRTHGLIAT